MQIFYFLHPKNATPAGFAARRVSKKPECIRLEVLAWLELTARAATGATTATASAITAIANTSAKAQRARPIRMVSKHF
ncbi:MAG TPA: hypothetical protein VHH73_19895, partial [Verrucomicrobiae bacterium]|nr:hypothetical protein [Verrucomicrobiae bacterium]